MMIIPRERRLVRCYIQLSHEDAAALTMSMDPARMVDIVRRILSPYKFEVSRVEWSTIYSVCLFLTSMNDDVIKPTVADLE